MSCGSSGTNTVESTSAPPAVFTDAYGNLVNQAQTAASQPLEQYSGDMIAGFTPDQENAFNTIDSAQGIANPYINAASQYIAAGTAPVNVPGSIDSSGLEGLAQTGVNYSGTAANTGIVSAGAPQVSGALNDAATNVYGSLQPVNASTISQYESPYTQQVVNATQAEYNNQNQQQNQSIVGNAESSGAWGGDRASVAQANATNQEQLAQAPVIAGLENTGYSQALGELNTQQGLQASTEEQQASLGAQTGLSAANLQQTGTSQQAALQQQSAAQMLGLYTGQQQEQTSAQQASDWLAQNAGYGMSNLGNEALNTSLSGANAELQSGALQQQMAQEELNIPYEQFEQAQAYPFQTTSWLSGIEGVGPGGGTSSTTSPSPSAASTVAGLGLTGLAGYNLLTSGSGGAATTAAETGDSAVAGTTGASPGLGLGTWTGGRVPHSFGGAIRNTGGIVARAPRASGGISDAGDIPGIMSDIPTEMGGTGGKMMSDITGGGGMNSVTSGGGDGGGILGDLIGGIGLANNTGALSGLGSLLGIGGAGAGLAGATAGLAGAGDIAAAGEAVADLAPLILLAHKGGRIPRDMGGAITNLALPAGPAVTVSVIPGQTGVDQKPQRQGNAMGVPQAHPAQEADPAQQGMQTLGLANSINGLLKKPAPGTNTGPSLWDRMTGSSPSAPTAPGANAPPSPPPAAMTPPPDMPVTDAQNQGHSGGRMPRGLATGGGSSAGPGPAPQLSFNAPAAATSAPAGPSVAPPSSLGIIGYTGSPGRSSIAVPQLSTPGGLPSSGISRTPSSNWAPPPETSAPFVTVNTPNLNPTAPVTTPAITPPLSQGQIDANEGSGDAGSGSRHGGAIRAGGGIVAPESSGMGFYRRGGMTGYDDGGSVTAQVGAGATQAMTGGNPNMGNLYSQYSGMTQEQLQELAMRVPASSPQGSLIQRALQSKRMNSMSDVQQPVTTASTANGMAPALPQVTGSTVTPTMAGGGRAGFDGGGGATIPPDVQDFDPDNPTITPFQRDAGTINQQNVDDYDAATGSGNIFDMIGRGYDALHSAPGRGAGLDAIEHYFGGSQGQKLPPQRQPPAPNLAGPIPSADDIPMPDVQIADAAAAPSAAMTPPPKSAGMPGFGAPDASGKTPYDYAAMAYTGGKGPPSGAGSSAAPASDAMSSPPPPPTSASQPAAAPAARQKGFTDSPWFPVMAAGLGMMAGRSPFASVNIGAGGLEGLKVAQQQQTSERQADAQEAEITNRQKATELEAQKLSETIDQHKADLAQRTQAELDLKDYRDQIAGQGKVQYLGPSTDPNNPGAMFLNSKDGTVSVKPFQVGAKTGVAGGIGDRIRQLMEADQSLSYADAQMKARQTTPDAGTTIQLDSQARANAIAEFGSPTLAQLNQHRSYLGLPPLGPQAAPAAGTKAGPAAAPSGVPSQAIEYLRANPSAAPLFDQKYGAGASKQYLSGP